MTTFDRAVISIILAIIIVMICLVPFCTRDLVLRGLPERRECACSVGLLHDGAKPSDKPKFTSDRVIVTDSLILVGGITNTPDPNGVMWIPVPGLRTNLTLDNPVVRVVITMDANRMLKADVEPR